MAAVLLVGLGAAAPRYDWSTADLSVYGKGLDKEMTVTRRICAQVIAAEPPLKDYPTALERQGLAGCDSEALFFGLGVRADPERARKCALIQRAAPSAQADPFFSGAGILAMAYANGVGAERNLDVALHLACGMPDAPKAVDDRITHLDSLRRASAAGAFDICDDASASLSDGVCAAHENRVATSRRSERLAALQLGWTTGQKALFARVVAALSDYLDLAHSQDCPGAEAAACQRDGRNGDLDKFLGRIEALGGRQSLPRRDESRKGASAAPEPGSTALDDADWRRKANTLPWDQRKGLEAVHDRLLSARYRFEAALNAFARSRFPQMHADEVSGLYSDF